MDLAQFKKNAKTHGICDMLHDWDNCKSKKQLMDVALSIRGIEYIARSTAEGWGLTPDYISLEFAPFNNGKYIRNMDGYTSALFCASESSMITITTTAVLVIGYDGEIVIPRNHICELYICQSNVVIHGDGRGLAYLYNSTINNPDTAPVVIKEDKHYGLDSRN